MYEQYAIEDDAASIVSDATILADRYDAVMADTDFQESRSVNIYTDLHPVSIPSIYDEDVAAFVRTSLMQNQKENEGGEEKEEEEDNGCDNYFAPKDDVSTSGGSSSSLHLRKRAPSTSHIQNVQEHSQRRGLKWRAVLGRHEAFDVSRPPPLSQQGSLLRLCSSGWQPPPRLEHAIGTISPVRSINADEDMYIPIPTISWAAGRVDGPDDDSSISFNIHFSNLSDASASSDMGSSNDEERNASSTGSTITEETAMLLDRFIKFEENGDIEESEGLRLLDDTPLFALSFDLGVGRSLDSTISDEEDGESIGESYRTASSSTASETVGESPSESVAAESGGNDSGLESRDSFTTFSETECSGQVSTVDNGTIGSSTVRQHRESNKDACAHSKAGSDDENSTSTCSDAESFSSNSSATASTTSEIITPTESFLVTLTCGAMGTREAIDLVDEVECKDIESAASSSTFQHSYLGNTTSNKLEEKSRASDKSSNVSFDEKSYCADTGDLGVEVEINSCFHSKIVGLDSMKIQANQYNGSDKSHEDQDAKRIYLEGALYPEVVNALGMQISLYACRRTKFDAPGPKNLQGILTSELPFAGAFDFFEEKDNASKKKEGATSLHKRTPRIFTATVRGKLSRLSREARVARVIGESAPTENNAEGNTRGGVGL